MQYVQVDYLCELHMSYFLEKEMLVFFSSICSTPYIIEDMHNGNVMYHQEIEGVYVCEQFSEVMP